MGKVIVYDEELRIEAYRFEGMIQSFPSHFHEHYVIGTMEKGERRLFCAGREETLRAGDAVLLNPGDSHGCEQTDGGKWDYRGFSIPENVMFHWVGSLPRFSPNVIRDGDAAAALRALHERIMAGERDWDREEGLLMLISMMVQKYGQFPESAEPDCCAEIDRACAFMEQNYARRVTLDEMARCAGMSKSTLIRAFSRRKGVTPYRYLENIRISRARKLLEQGMAPVEAALATGFSDQSHFTNAFGRYIGLAPGVYREIFSGRETMFVQRH